MTKASRAGIRGCSSGNVPESDGGEEQWGKGEAVARRVVCCGGVFVCGVASLWCGAAAVMLQWNGEIGNRWTAIDVTDEDRNGPGQQPTAQCTMTSAGSQRDSLIS